MKTNSRIIIVAFTSILLGLITHSSTLFAAKESKAFSKEFKADKKTHLLISNRFGQVVIENWDKNLIKIDVVVTVEHTSKDRAERMLSAIDVKLEQVGSEVRGITEIDERIMKSVSAFNITTSTKDIRIDYKITMPKSLNVNLKNKYGDIFIDELTGLSTIDVKYGNIKANRIVYGSNDPLSLITLGYGNLSIDEVNWMRFDIKYAILDIDKAQAVVMLSKYSTLKMNQVNSLVIESKYDNISMGTVSNIVGESGYTTYRIKSFLNKLDIKSRYGDVRIEDVASGFEQISFVGSYASIYAPITIGVTYELNGNSSYGGISYNSPARVSRIESNNNLSVNGRVGEDSGSKSQVNIKVRYGSAKLN